MKSYVMQYKKLVDKTSNNYRKLHGEPTKRWVQLRKAYDATFRYNAKSFRRAINSIANLSEAYARVNVMSANAIRAALGIFNTRVY